MASELKRGLSLRRIVVGVIIAMVVFSPCLVPDAMGFTDPLTVFLTYPDIEYRIGEEITAQAHVFRNGARFDPDTVRFTVGKNYTRHPMERKDVGLWEGQVLITEDELSYEDDFAIEVQVYTDTPDHEWDFDSHLVWVSGIGHTHVNLYIDDSADYTPVPGQDVEFTVTVTHGNRFVDPEPGSLSVWANQSEGPLSEELQVTRRSDGVFGGNFTVPADVDTDMDLRLIAYAGHNDGTTTTVRSGGERIYVALFDIWVRNVDVDRKGAISEVHVNDRQGDPIAGAPVKMNLTYLDHTGEWNVSWMNGTTDDEGIYRVEVLFAGINLSFWGSLLTAEVEADGFTQRFGYWILHPDYEMEVETEPETLRVQLMNEEPVPAGSNVDLRFLVTYNRTPLVHHEIISYIYSDHEVMFNGTLTTDEAGEVTINVETPGHIPYYSSRLSLYSRFKTMMPNGSDSAGRQFDASYWETTKDHRLWRWTNTSMDLVHIGGGSYRFTLRSTDLDGIAENVEVYWGMGIDDDERDPLNPAWSRADWYGHALPEEVVWTGEAYEGTIKLPSFVPEDAVFHVTATIDMVDMPHSDRRYAYIFNTTAYVANEAPSVEITSPSNGKTLEGRILVRGVTSDDVGVTIVDVRIDGGNWAVVEGTEDWELKIPDGTLEVGIHVLEARAYDGMKYSVVDRVEFRYEKVVQRAFETWPIVLLLVILLVMVTTSVVLLTRRTETFNRMPDQP